MFYFAWVDASETTFSQSLKRMDDIVLGFDVSQQEGDFAAASIDLQNPHVGLLNATRKQWAWLSWVDPSSGSSDAVPLFFGRLVGVPDSIDKEIISVSFIARPANFDVLKSALAETLKVAPYWDPVWIEPARRDVADVVLEARPQRWAIDRVSHAVTVSDIMVGEAGVVDVVGADIIEGSLAISYGEAPLRQVNILADVLWVQQAQGVVDFSPTIVAAFKALGTTEPYLVSTYTGQGLYDDWPQPGDDFGGGWQMDSSADFISVDGSLVKYSYKNITVQYDKTPATGVAATTSAPFNLKFPLAHFRPVLTLAYDAARDRTESVAFSLHADVQSLLTDAGDSESVDLSFSSSEITALIDNGGTTRPIGALSRRQYFTTDRGRVSLEYLIATARATLLARARAVEIEIATSFAKAALITMRHSASLTAPQLPGGVALGKVVGQSFSCRDGTLTGSVKIACMIGQGNTVVPQAGSPDYVDDGYVADGYQTRTGQTVMPIAGAVTYTPLTNGPLDDGYDFDNMVPATTLQSLTVANGVTVQTAALDRGYRDTASALEGLNAVYTTVDMVLKPVAAGPFEQSYGLTVSDLMVPKYFALDAA